MLRNGWSPSGARPENIRSINCRAVLDLFSHSDKLSVQEITSHSNLSKTAAANIINLLLSMGIIYLYGKDETVETAGKKPSLYALNPSYKYSIVLGARAEGVVAELFDFQLNKVSSHMQKSRDTSYKSFIESASHAIMNLLQSSNVPSDELYGVVVYTGGIVDANEGILLRPITYDNWENDLPLIQDLNNALPFDAPIFIDNICRYSGYYELLKRPNYRNLTFLSLFINESGVGGSLIQNGVIARGKYGLIGEFGHITTDYTMDEKCKCGRYGCFETVVTGKNVTDLFAKADNGDTSAMSELDFIVNQFANMLYNMQIMYDPDMVILQGIYSDSGTYFKKKLNAAVNDLSLYSIAKNLRIIFSTHSIYTAAATGAASYCRDQYLNGDPLFDAQ